MPPIWRPPEKRGRIVGTVFSGVLMGILLARTFSGFLGAHWGWRSVYWIAAGMMLLLSLLIRFGLPASGPTVKMTYGDLLKSLIHYIRKYPELRESAFVGAMIFASFSAFWTTLAFHLSTPPFHYGSEMAGVFGLIGATGGSLRAFCG